MASQIATVKTTLPIRCATYCLGLAAVATSGAQIIDIADVGRTTFYAHFYTKDELLKAYVEKILDSIPAAEGQDIPVRTLFEHVKTNLSQIRSVITDPVCGDMLFRKAKEYWTGRLLRPSAQLSPPSGVPKEFFVNHLVQTLIECVRWWIATKMKQTPQEMEQYYHALTTVSTTSSRTVDGML